MRKLLVASAVGLAVVISANVVSAYVAVVTTAIAVTPAAIANRGQLGDVVRAAVRDVLDHAVGFTPTVVSLEKATVIGDRLYLILFIADKDGEALMEALSTNLAPESAPDGEADQTPGSGDGVFTPRETPSREPASSI